MKNLLSELPSVIIAMAVIGFLLIVFISFMSGQKRVSRVEMTPKRVNENLWSEVEVTVVAYLATYKSYKDLDIAIINLLESVLGRSEGSIKRKLQRIHALRFGNTKGSSVLDRKIYNKLSRIGDQKSLELAKISVVILGGDPYTFHKLVTVQKS